MISSHFITNKPFRGITMRQFIVSFSPLVISLFLLLPSRTTAQLYVNGAILKIQNGAILKIEGDLTTANVGMLTPSIRNWGLIAIAGNAVFNTDAEYKGNGDMCFVGSSEQTLTPNGIPMKKIDVQNSNNITLAGDLNLQRAITLTNGHIQLGDFDLTLDDSITITGGSSTSYIRINGTGRLVATVDNDPVVLPIGRNPYLPIIMNNGGGVEYAVGVAIDAYEDPEAETNLQSANVVTETWNIQAASAQTGVFVQIGWESSEEASGFDRDNCHMAYWEEGVDMEWNVGSKSAATGSDPYFRVRTVDFSTNKYYFGMGSNGAPLPVELSAFNAHWIKPGESALLRWTTASEMNTRQFAIEKSFDGIQWQTIGYQAAQLMRLSETQYSFVDPKSIDNQNMQNEVTVFYRLRIIDTDENTEYSVIKSLDYGVSEPTFTIYPNPLNGNTFTVSKYGNYKLLSMTGVVLASIVNGNGFDVAQLPQGVYLIKNDNGETATLVRQ